MGKARESGLFLGERIGIFSCLHCLMNEGIVWPAHGCACKQLATNNAAWLQRSLVMDMKAVQHHFRVVPGDLRAMMEAVKKH